jgi:hypothetical protein
MSKHFEEIEKAHSKCGSCASLMELRSIYSGTVRTWHECGRMVSNSYKTQVLPEYDYCRYHAKEIIKMF